MLGPLGTSATEWPIVPAPGDCDDGEFGGMKIGGGNRSTRRKPAPTPICPLQIPLARPGLELGPPRWEASDYLLELWRCPRVLYSRVFRCHVLATGLYATISVSQN
jgi:hypothetical protein